MVVDPGGPPEDFPGVAAEVRDPAHGLRDRRHAIGDGLDAALDLALRGAKGFQFGRRQLDGRGRIGLGASEVLQTFDTSGHGGEHRSPSDDAVGSAELRVLDVAVTALPRSVKVLDTPSKAVALDDGDGVIEVVDSGARQQHPVQPRSATRSPPLASPDDANRKLRASARCVLGKLQYDVGDPHIEHSKSCLAVRTGRNIDDVSAEDALLVEVLEQRAASAVAKHHGRFCVARTVNR